MTTTNRYVYNRRRTRYRSRGSISGDFCIFTGLYNTNSSFERVLLAHFYNKGERKKYPHSAGMTRPFVVILATHRACIRTVFRPEMPRINIFGSFFFFGKRFKVLWYARPGLYKEDDLQLVYVINMRQTQRIIITPPKK